jgi:hypothetical protein
MSTPLLLIAIAGMGAIIFWYVFDEATRGGEGKSGILGMSDRVRDGRKDSGGGTWKSKPANKPWRAHRH